jgi:hypothetical protein
MHESVLSIGYKMPASVHENAGQNAYKYTHEKRHYANTYNEFTYGINKCDIA